MKENKVKVPKAKDFDFAAWLDGDAQVPATAQVVAAPTFSPTAVMKQLGPKTQRLAPRRVWRESALAHRRVLIWK